MSEEPNPYMPPAASEWVMPVVLGAGRDWFLEGGKLLVRDDAVLPDVCIVSGVAGTSGRRVWLPLSVLPRALLKGRRIKVSVFRSYRGVAKDILRMVGPPLAGTLAAVVCSEWMIGDGSATTLSVSASFGLMGLGFAYSIFQTRKALQIVASKDGWHELQGVHPAAIRQLDALQDSPAPSQGEVAMPSTP